MLKTSRTVSIYNLLKILFLAAMGGVVAVYHNVGASSYVNSTTVILSLVLCVVSLFVISDSKKKDNPLLFVLAWWCLFFYVIRIITLNYTDYSVCLKRCGAGVDDVNNGLVLTILCVITLWLVFRSIKTTRNKAEIDVRYKPGYVRRALIIYWVTFFINVVAEYGLPMSGLASIIRNFILNIFDLLYLLLAYTILIWDRIEKKEKLYMGLSMLAFIAFVTLSGSRSGFYSIFKMLLFVFLALGYKKIKRIYIWGVVALVPVMLAFFIYSTYMRQMGMMESSLQDKVGLIEGAIDKTADLETRVVVSPVFDRIGFIDYTTEMMVSKERFKSFVNVGFEFKSIVDNALSPGFDLFDAPKISNMIDNSYNLSSSKVISKTANSSEDYHSDELTAFGESYVLFGFIGGILFMFIAGILFRNVWNKADKKKNEQGLFQKAICLYLFEVFLSSYGYDWLVLNLICFLLTMIIFNASVFGRAGRLKKGQQLLVKA